MIDPTLTLTQRLAFNEVIVTNGGVLSAPIGLDCGNLLLKGSILNLGTNSTGSDAIISNARLIGTNGLALIGTVTLSATNYIRGSGALGSLTNTGTNTLDGVFTFSSLLVASNSVLTTVPEVALDLTVSGEARVMAGGWIDARFKGYQGQSGSRGRGPGAGTHQGSAGGYGGTGGQRVGTTGGEAYGLLEEPADFGSSGGSYGSDIGGSGGGLIRLSAQSLFVDGTISADGESRSGAIVSAAGAGGGIKLMVSSLAGAGAISAAGGDNTEIHPWDDACAGGAGRVALYYGEKSAFTGVIRARGGKGQDNSGAPNAQRSGGAGTVYLKKSSEAYGELIVDNGGTATAAWSTPLLSQEIVRLNSWTISGNARVSTTDGVRVANGNPAQFAGLISSNYLRVGGLIISNTWVYGDIMDLSANRTNGFVSVTVIGQPLKSYLLLASTNLVDWVPVFTNTPTGSRFDYLDANTSSFRQRFYHVAMLDHLFDAMKLSLNPTNRRATLTLRNAQPSHTLVLQASEDLRHWTSLSTNTPTAVTNWQFLDTNAPAFDKRFYRAVGQGK